MPATTNGSRGRILASRRALAEVLRAEVSPEFISMYLLEIAQGHDPRVTLRDYDPATGKQRAGKPSKALPEQVPTLEQSFTAMKELLMRRDGAPAQQLQLDHELSARTLNLDASVDVNALAGMSPDQLRALVSTLRPLMLGKAPEEAATGAAIAVAKMLTSGTEEPDE